MLHGRAAVANIKVSEKPICHCWTERLVETTSDGGSNRGPRLTDKGREIKSCYRGLEGQLAAAVTGNAFAGLTAGLRETPLLPGDAQSTSDAT